SVGRYWIERHKGSSLASELNYYIPQEVDSDCKDPISPQDVTVLDPCVGSGHFLVYAIDVLMKIYREYGYSDREAIAEIINHNIFGLDIDDRAVELAYFAIMMKGCQYDKRFLKRGIQPHVYSIVDSRFADDAFMTYFCGSNTVLQTCTANILEAMKDAFETGSLIQIPTIEFDTLERQIECLNVQKDLFHSKQLKSFCRIVKIARILSERYAAVITNPPYLNKYDATLKSFLQENYKDYSGDLFSVFIYRCMLFCKSGGYAGLMTPNVWMFIKSYAKLRRYILTNHSITTLVQMAKGAFFNEATVDVCAFVIQCDYPGKTGVYFRLEDFTGNMDYQNQKLCEALRDPSCNYRYQASSLLFENLPGMQIGYWAGEHILNAFQTGHALEANASPRQGLATTDNNKYLRHWYEVDYGRIGFGLDRRTAVTSNIKWFPYNKGGEFRKWYGNQDYVVNYQHDGECIKRDVLTKYPYLKTPDFVVKNPDTYFSPSLSWSKISSGSVAFRYFPQGFLYDVSGCSIFFKHTSDLYYYAGFLNGVVCSKILEIISPTLNYETGHIGILPIIDSNEHRSRVEQLVHENIRLSEEDWDTSETSWNFGHCPFGKVTIEGKLADIFKVREDECNARFAQLKANEEELNRIFIDIYGMQNELTPEVDDNDVTMRKADLTRDVKALISYAVGCMFGRYSLDREGLCYAGGDFCKQFIEVSNPCDGKIDGHTSRCYLKVIASTGNMTSHFGVKTDNIIPITDDEYFADDIVNRFVEFVRVAYGADTLEENIRFVADALGGKGTARDVIRNYFLNDFYTDHLKVYQKRPIYWLFSSGKKNGFKCLIYMHRYQQDTIARIRTDYVHELQSRYLTFISNIESRIPNALGSEAVKLKKQLKKIQDQADELRKYEEKIHHLADQMIAIDLDDGVKINYAKFEDVLATVK
ncbi:MAG: BREX-1 system adenine-specific DNA-methyltransferase PglX, partial [Proteobacteria bacterium]|nr:BREX-1 system adenine-specific DNA-methyltransferase PglX [Pseudomonadota bacterium]